MAHGVIGVVRGTAGMVRRTGGALFEASVRDMRASARGLAGVAVRTAGIARHAGGALLFSGVAAALLCGLGHLGIPLVVAAFFLGVGAAATVGKRSYEDTFRLLKVGTLVLACALPCLGAVLVGARLAEAHGEAHYLSGWALFLGLTFLGTFVLVPLLEAAPRLALGRGGVGDAVSAALVATGRRGLLHTLVVGVGATSAVALVPLLDALGPVRLIGTELDSDSLPQALGIAGAGGGVSWTILMLLGGALATEPSEPRQRSRSAFTFVIVGIVLFVGATLIGTTLLPAPLGHASPELAGRTSAAAPASSGLSVVVERDTPGGPGLLVVRRNGTVTVTVPVSGGYFIESVVPRPHHTYAVVLGVSPGAAAERGAIWIDERGNRLDDSPLDRIAAHVAGAAAVSFALSLFFVALAVFRTRARARLHRAVRRGTESVVTGRLRGGDGAQTRLAAGIARVEGWRLDAADGACIVAVPPNIPVLGGAADGWVSDGQEIELVAPAPLRGLAFREGATPCPRGAALVLPGSGRLDELVGTWALAPGGLLLAASSVAAIAGTILTLGGAPLVGGLLPWLSDETTAGYMAPVPMPSEVVSTAGYMAPVPMPSEVVYEGADAPRVARVSASARAGSIVVVSTAETHLTSALRYELVNATELPDGAHLDRFLTLSDVRRGSVLDLLGFHNGDVILAVAGIHVRDLGSLRALLVANRHAGALGVRVARAGVPLALTFRVLDR